MVGVHASMSSVLASPRTTPERTETMSTKRQQTMAKIERERTVRERRALKLERKQAAAAERKAAKEAGLAPPTTIDAG
jgi:hypothetical protein